MMFAIDIDGVAADHANAICEWVKEKYKIEAKLEHVTEWDYDFGPIGFIEATKKCYSNPNFIKKMGVTCGFPKFLGDLIKIVDVKFVTTRKSMHDETIEWIDSHFGDFAVTFVNQKIDVEFDFLIDDSHMEVIKGAQADRVCFLIKRPWNDKKSIIETVSALQNVFICKEFHEVLKITKKFIGNGHDTK